MPEKRKIESGRANARDVRLRTKIFLRLRLTIVILRTKFVALQGSAILVSCCFNQGNSQSETLNSMALPRLDPN